MQNDQNENDQEETEFGESYGVEECLWDINIDQLCGFEMSDPFAFLDDFQLM